ncbi:MAG: LacI family DNA-binding transcriptional regulator [Anaerolineae bacterium]|nr:LacI family transcriptional regulator [Candidatus Roseilinea sp.]MDW8449307.1 LacI family DNA-binding transcriptional regulator [Anaerolineae bacterium]
MRVHKRPTQGDVARLAGVSQATVSHVLNNSTVISASTRQRILDAVEQLGYVPDSSARRLRMGKTFTIASVIPDIGNPFYPQFERGIQDISEDAGYDLMIYNTDGMAEKERKCLRALQHGRVDGVIGVFFHINARDLRSLIERNVAVVRLENRAQELGELPIDNLFVDNAAAARAAVRHLIARGHTRIGIIAGQTEPRSVRMRGYSEALSEAGIAIDDALIQMGDAFTEAGGYEGMRRLLALSSPPTAVFAANDLMAMGALMAIREAGLQVPRDMAVVGFDDIPAAKLVTPPLTTVSQFQEQLGRRAAEMLLERMTGTVTGPARSVEMPFKLIVREST